VFTRGTAEPPGLGRVGADDARGHIAWMADQCPGIRIALGGFSQGGSAVSMSAVVPPIGDRIGSIGSAPALLPGAGRQRGGRRGLR
jgi:alpha/beta superfamily hydrolase